MPVQHATHRIGHGLVMVIALDQHGRDQGDGAAAPLRPRPRTFQQPRQFGEDRRRVAARGRRLSGREADLAAGLREAGDGIEQQQHALPGIAEGLGDRHRGQRRLAPQRRRRVGGGADHHAARQAFGTQIVLDEFAQLPPPLPDEAEDRHVEARRAGQHRQQRGLAHTRAGEQPDALALPQGAEQVERPHAQADARPQPGAAPGRRRVGQHRAGGGGREGPERIERRAQRVHHAAEPGRAGAEPRGPDQAERRTSPPSRRPGEREGAGLTGPDGHHLGHAILGGDAIADGRRGTQPDDVDARRTDAADTSLRSVVLYILTQFLRVLDSTHETRS